jgi:hypothetical protein
MFVVGVCVGRGRHARHQAGLGGLVPVEALWHVGKVDRRGVVDGFVGARGVELAGSGGEYV